MQPVSTQRLVGLLVKASALGAEDPRFESRLRWDFSGSSRTSDLKIGTPVATLPGAWHYRVSAGTGQHGVSILWLGEVESLICNFYLSVAAHKIVCADPSLRYTSMFLGCKTSNIQSVSILITTKLNSGKMELEQIPTVIPRAARIMLPVNMKKKENLKGDQLLFSSPSPPPPPLPLIWWNVAKWRMHNETSSLSVDIKSYCCVCIYNIEGSGPKWYISSML